MTVVGYLFLLFWVSVSVHPTLSLLGLFPLSPLRPLCISVGCSPCLTTSPSFLCTETRPPLLYHLTAVSNPSKGVPSFWATGWLGPQQYLSYNSLRQEAEACGAWMWESQMSWYWEKETVDLKSKEQLFLDAIKTLTTNVNVPQGGVAWD